MQSAVEDAIEDGLSPDELSDLLTERVGCLTVWDSSRADLIARTETMFAYNEAALTSYRQLDVGHVVALDGDKDHECARPQRARVPHRRSLSHRRPPERHARLDPGRQGVNRTRTRTGSSLQRRPSAPPAPPQTLRLEVTSEPPVLNVEPPIVNVEAPIVNVDTARFDAAIKAIQDELARPRQPVRKRIVRDSAGLIVEVIEE